MNFNSRNKSNGKKGRFCSDGFDYDAGQTFFEPKRYVSLEEQLNNPVFQRDTCYENASELFEYDSTRINDFMTRITEARYIYFNKIFPEVLTWRKQYKFITVDQVINFINDYEAREIETNGVNQPVQTLNFNNRMNAVLGAIPPPAPPVPAIASNAVPPPPPPA